MLFKLVLLLMWKCEKSSSSRNGANVEGATHKQVVDLIKSSGDKLILTVISVTPKVIEVFTPSLPSLTYINLCRKPKSLSHRMI